MDKIRIKTGVDEWNNVVYFRTFEIKNSLPQIGDEQSDGTTVTTIRECYRDCEDRTPRPAPLPLAFSAALVVRLPHERRRRRCPSPRPL